MNLLLNKDYVFKRKRIGRVGIIDVGSNSVRLVVFAGFSRSPTYFFNEKVLCGLGKGLSQNRKLNLQGKEKAIRAIKRFVTITKTMNLTELVGVATAAVRNAIDGRQFVMQVQKETSLQLYVASGLEEAELSANGVFLGWPDAVGIVCDIGGGSLEVADVDNGKVGVCGTSGLGALVLSDFPGDSSQLRDHIKRSVANLVSNSKVSSKNLFLVGGSFRAFAKVDMSLANYPLKVLHEYKITRDQALETAIKITQLDTNELISLCGSSPERVEFLPMAALVLIDLIKVLNPQDIYFSSYGLREGVLFYQMPKIIKELDPLIEACRYQESLGARFPGFGERLFNWLLPIFEEISGRDKRLFRAACLLHDTTWRAHPDYRSEMSFETVTRANLGGIDHEGRIFLALALMSRYKKIPISKRLEGPFKILSSLRSKQAIALGRAMRLGAMLSGSSVANLKKSKIFIKHDTIYLLIRKSGRNLAADTVERRLEALGASLNRKYLMQIKNNA